MFLAFAFLLAIGTVPQDADAWLSRLRTESLSSVPPQAVVLRLKDRGPSQAISFYRTRATGAANSWMISARMEIWNGADMQVSWASITSCPNLAEAVRMLDRVPLPRPETAPTELGPWPYPPPRMGPSHMSHRLWMRASDADGVPITITLSSLGAGSPGSLFDKIDDQLSACWARQPPS